MGADPFTVRSGSEFARSKGLHMFDMIARLSQLHASFGSAQFGAEGFPGGDEQKQSQSLNGTERGSNNPRHFKVQLALSRHANNIFPRQPRTTWNCNVVSVCFSFALPSKLS